MTVRIARSDELRAIAELIVTENGHPARHCIQSETGTDVRTTAEEMRRGVEAGRLVVVAAFHGADVVGALGCEWDGTSGRGWLRGPFARGDAEPTPMFRALLSEMLTALPGAVRRVDAFLNVENSRASAFYQTSGFHAVRHIHVYWAKRDNVDVGASRDGIGPPLALERATAELHDQLFPGTYISGAGILAERDDDHRLFVRFDDSGVLGSVSVVADHDASEAFVQFLGVRPDARRRGIGEDLLRSALKWGFTTKGFPTVALSVHDELENARSLYERVGFARRYTGLHLRHDL